MWVEIIVVDLYREVGKVCLTGFSILYKQSGFGLVEGEAESTVIAAGVGEDIERAAVDALHGADFAQGSELLWVDVHAVLPELSEQGAAAFTAIQPLNEGFLGRSGYTRAWCSFQ